MSAGSALVRAVFGDSDDSDSDGADDRASSGRAAGRLSRASHPRLAIALEHTSELIASVRGGARALSL